MKHLDLVILGEKWLQAQNHCVVTACELSTSMVGEIPDVIGWTFSGDPTYLIEAKISLSDFEKDRKKRFRLMPEMGVGKYRYFLVPVELESKVLDKLPEKWGLIVPHKNGKSIRVVRKSEMFNRDIANESAFLVSICRRLALMSRPLLDIKVKAFVPMDPNSNLLAGVYVQEMFESGG